MPRAPDFDGDESRGSSIDRASGKGASILAIKSRNWLLTQNNADKHGVDMSRDSTLIHRLAPDYKIDAKKMTRGDASRLIQLLLYKQEELEEGADNAP